MRIKIHCEISREGGMVLWPVNKRWQRAYGKHLQSFYVQSHKGLCLIQNNIHEMKEHFTASQWRDMEHGWSVIVIMDPWDYGNLLGWDACNVTLPTRKRKV